MGRYNEADTRAVPDLPAVRQYRTVAHPNAVQAEVDRMLDVLDEEGRLLDRL